MKRGDMLDLDDLFDLPSILGGSLGKKYTQCPRPVEAFVRETGLGGLDVDKVLSFERLWAHFIDDLTPAIGPGAQAVVSGDWSGLDKNALVDMLGVWRVWTRYRKDLRESAQRLNPLAKGGAGIDPRIARLANDQLRGFNAFQSALSVTEAREKKGAFARFKDWLTGKSTNLKQSMQNFDFDQWAEGGWGQAATGLAAAGVVAAMSYRGDVEGYQEERALPTRERFDEWEDLIARYPGTERLEHTASKSVTKLGYGTVIGHMPDGRVVLETTVSLWVVDPNSL